MPPRGRPSKAAAAASAAASKAKKVVSAVSAVAAKVKKAVKSDVESEDDESLSNPATPPPSGRRAKESKKRIHRDSSEEGEAIEDTRPSKQAKKDNQKKATLALAIEADMEATKNVGSGEDSEEEQFAKSSETLGTPIVIKKRGKAAKKKDILEVVTTEEDEPEPVKKIGRIKPINFELPSSQSDGEKEEEGESMQVAKVDKGKGKKGAGTVTFADIRTSEADDEEEEEEYDLIDMAMDQDLSALEKYVLEGGEPSKDVFSSFSNKQKGVLMADLQASSFSTSDPSPEEDQVLDRTLQDRHLVRSYKGMANRCMRFILSKTDEIGDPNPPLSFFFKEGLYPGINKEFIIKGITFDKFKRWYNLSRVILSYLTHMEGYSSRKDKLLIATTFNATEVGVALSVVMVKDSYLHTAQNWSDNKSCKLFKGKFLSQEYTLFQSGLGMALNLEEMYGPVTGGWVSFTCRPTTGPETAKFSPNKSRMTSTGDIKTSIGSECNLIVLDGRNRTFGFNDDLYRLSSLLPRFPYEIPYGSLALVAYVPNLYNYNQLGCSFSWVVVLATPSSANIPPPRTIPPPRISVSRSGEASSSRI